MNSDDQLVVLDGSTFLVSGRDGDCSPSQETGFFYQDIRHLSHWRLAALRFRPSQDLAWSLPVAGLPWFMALFGRDSLICAYQALPARRARRPLAARQSPRSASPLSSVAVGR